MREAQRGGRETRTDTWRSRCSAERARASVCASCSLKRALESERRTRSSLSALTALLASLSWRTQSATSDSSRDSYVRALEHSASACAQHTHSQHYTRAEK